MSAWQDLFSELRRVYENVSDLLLDSQRLLDGAGWRIAHGKAAQIGIERSGDINQPNLWAPHYIARFFEFENKPAPLGPLLYVNCVLSDGGASDYTLLDQGTPVLTAGLLRFAPDAPSKQWNWSYSMAKCWFWTAKEGWPTPTWQQLRADWLAKAGIDFVECIAIPLNQVTGRDALGQLVIEPLLLRAELRRRRPDIDDPA